MRKLTLLALAAILLAACGQSPQQKAEKLVKEKVKKNLFKPDSYDPIETKVDSAFFPFDDPDIFREVNDLKEKGSNYIALEKEVMKAKSQMAFYEDGKWSSSFWRSSYEEAKSEYEDYYARFKNLESMIQEQTAEFTKRIHAEKRFLGYKAVHSYRAETNSGDIVIERELFFIDPNFEKVTFTLGVDSYNDYQKVINNFMSRQEGETIPIK